MIHTTVAWLKQQLEAAQGRADDLQRALDNQQTQLANTRNELGETLARIADLRVLLSAETIL